MVENDAGKATRFVPKSLFFHPKRIHKDQGFVEGLELDVWRWAPKVCDLILGFDNFCSGSNQVEKCVFLLSLKWWKWMKSSDIEKIVWQLNMLPLPKNRSCDSSAKKNLNEATLCKGPWHGLLKDLLAYPSPKSHNLLKADRFPSLKELLHILLRGKITPPSNEHIPSQGPF